MTPFHRFGLALSLPLVALAACSSHPQPGPDVVTTDARDASDVPAAPDVTDVSDVPSTDAPDVVAPTDVPTTDAIDAQDVAPPDVATMDADYTDATDATDAPMGDVPLFVDAACSARYAAFTPDPGVHIVDPEAGPPAVWSTNPPSSGVHYPEWATWGVHTDVVPRVNYVHNLEHGGVVIQYRCDGDCASVRAELVDFVTHLPPEAACAGMGVDRRIVLTEDPLIDAPVTASAWGWTYHADCFDRDSLAAFVFARTGHGPEDFCSQGTVN